jgi:hypothetical protein
MPKEKTVGSQAMLVAQKSAAPAWRMMERSEHFLWGERVRVVRLMETVRLSPTQTGKKSKGPLHFAAKGALQSTQSNAAKRFGQMSLHGGQTSLIRS